MDGTSSMLDGSAPVSPSRRRSPWRYRPGATNRARKRELWPRPISSSTLPRRSWSQNADAPRRIPDRPRCWRLVIRPCPIPFPRAWSECHSTWYPAPRDVDPVVRHRSMCRPGTTSRPRARTIVSRFSDPISVTCHPGGTFSIPPAPPGDAFARRRHPAPLAGRRCRRP